MTKVKVALDQDSLTIDDEAMLADIACVEPLSAHGLLGLVNLGDTFLTCYYRWVPSKMENGLLVRNRHIAHVITRPRSSVRPGGRFDTWLRAQPLAEYGEQRVGSPLN